MEKISKSVDQSERGINTSQPAPNGAAISVNPQPASSPTNDPFSNMRELGVDQDFSAISGVTKISQPVLRKPNRHEFFRVHPSPDYRQDMGILEMKTDREIFLVLRPLWPHLMGEVTLRMVYLAVTRQGDEFLWPMRLPVEDGRSDRWMESAALAAQTAMKRWTRLAANMSAGQYDIFEGSEELSLPVWSGTSFPDLCRIAFKGRIIDSIAHPALKKLRGES